MLAVTLRPIRSLRPCGPIDARHLHGSPVAMIAIPGMVMMVVALREIMMMVPVVVVRVVLMMLMVMCVMLVVLMMVVTMHFAIPIAVFRASVFVAIAPLRALPGRAPVPSGRHRGQRNHRHDAADQHWHRMLLQHRSLLQ